MFPGIIYYIYTLDKVTQRTREDAFRLRREAIANAKASGHTVAHEGPSEQTVDEAIVRAHREMQIRQQMQMGGGNYNGGGAHYAGRHRQIAAPPQEVDTRAMTRGGGRHGVVGARGYDPSMNGGYYNEDAQPRAGDYAHLVGGRGRADEGDDIGSSLGYNDDLEPEMNEYGDDADGDSWLRNNEGGAFENYDPRVQPESMRTGQGYGDGYQQGYGDDLDGDNYRYPDVQPEAAGAADEWGI